MKVHQFHFFPLVLILPKAESVPIPYKEFGEKSKEMPVKMYKNYMAVALKEAATAFERDEVPVGAAIVHKGQVIARAHNQIKMLKDPTAHAEMIAITQAAAHLKNERLNDCDMYVTIEPCPMCAGAMVLARIKNLYYAAKDPKSGAAGSVVNIAEHNSLNHRIKVTPGILREEASSLIREFFKKKRQSSP